MIVWLTAVALTWAAPADEAVVLDGNRQLFLDDALIARQSNVVRRIHPASKHPANPLIWPREEWEGKIALVHGSVIREDGKYRMWYLSQPGVGYAESDDGITWKKPLFDLIEVDGHKTNALVHGSEDAAEKGSIPYMYAMLGVLSNPAASDPDRRYMMAFLSIQRDYHGPREDKFHGGQRRGLGVASSPDGLHWKLIDNWASEVICDGPGHYMVDPVTGKYVWYGRTKYVIPEIREMWDKDEWCKKKCWGRSVTRIESEDFVHWNLTDPGTGPVILTMDTQDPLGTEFYSMKVFPYQGIYIGLLQVFHNQPDDCKLDVQLTVSRDGVNFERVGDRSTFIPNGPVGAWDRFNISLASNPPLEVGDELWFYFSGRTYRHSPYDGPDRGESGGGIGLATVKRDRFVSLGASFDGGEIVTKPLKLTGNKLHLNVQSDFGEVLVELIGADGSCLARSKPVKADALDAVVEWEEGGLEGITGPVSVRFNLRNALLFAFWCK